MLTRNKAIKLKIRKTRCLRPYRKISKCFLSGKSGWAWSRRLARTTEYTYMHATRAGLDRCRDNPARIDNLSSVLVLVAAKRDCIYDCGLGIISLMMYMGRCSVRCCWQRGFMSAHCAKSSRLVGFCPPSGQSLHWFNGDNTSGPPSIRGR